MCLSQLEKTHTSPNIGDGIAGINTITFDEYGDGIQYHKASELKSVVSSVVVTNPGVGLKVKRTIPTVGVNTVSNRVEIINHGYRDKEIVRYTKDDSLPSVKGLSESKDYYVHRINEDEFTLSEKGTGDLESSYYFDRNIIVDFVNAGRGSFNYPPITVSVEGTAASYDKTFVEDFEELFIIESPVEEDITTPERVLGTVRDGALQNLLKEVTQDTLVPRYGIHGYCK